MKKSITLILSAIILFTMTLGLVTTANGEAITIPNGDTTISADGEYQLCEGHSGSITIANNVNNVKVTDSAYQTSHTGTRIIIAGGRSELLELEIENLDIMNYAWSAIDFASAGNFEHKLYISGVCRVTGGSSGIHVPGGVTLIIDKAEGLSDSQAHLTATSGNYDAAAIGGHYNESGGDITINGGTITAVGYVHPPNSYSGSAAGIGGGVSGAGGSITINGGIVTATGGMQGAAIGGGSYAAAGYITINGGTVTANAGYNGIGIGCGVTGDGGTIRITGGTVKAYGSGLRAGIGGGDSSSTAGVTVIISGGTIEAAGGGSGAGIGGSYNGAGGNITISGGDITATGGESASGIGGGNNGAGGNITISGGTITASGGNYGGTGIGGGSGGIGGTISISGGTITATGQNRGAGIGGGSYGAGGTITISGGTVTAICGSEASGIGGGGFGAGADVTITGTPTILATGDTIYGAENIGNGRPYPDSEPVDPGTLEDGTGQALSYLRFSISEAPQANIKIEGVDEINGEYQTTGPGLFCTFAPRSGTFSYTVSKTGYAAVKGSQEITTAVHEIEVAMIVDEISPTINNPAPLFLKTGATAEIACNDYGIYGALYLVQKTDLQYTSAAALEWNYLEKIILESPAATANIETSTLSEGSYQIYAVDSAENVSNPKDIVIDNTSPLLVNAETTDNTHITVTFNEDCSDMTKSGNGGFSVYETGNPGIVYTVSSTQEGANARSVVLTTDDMGVSAKEGITVKYIASEDGEITDIAGNVLVTHSTGLNAAAWDTTQPAINTAVINTRNFFIDVTFSEGVYAADNGTTAITRGSLALTFLQNGGNATGAVISSIKQNSSTYEILAPELAGGESVVRIFLAITGVPSGLETIEIKPTTGSPIYDVAGNVMDETQTTGEISLHDQRVPKNNSGGTASSYTFEASITSLSSQGANSNILFNSPLGIISIPDNMLTGIEGISGQKIRLALTQGNNTGLPSDVKKLIGDHPLVQLTLSVDGRKVDWSNPNAPVTVSIPYTPTAKELKDPEHIIVWYIDGNGNVFSVPSGRYDSKTGMVTFTTTHFSCFAVAYVKKTFSDLESAKWAKKPIEVLASKGVLMDTIMNEYAPQTDITRADFLYSLVRALSVDATVSGNFKDIREDAYYYKEIAIARALGITNGIGDNKFNPDESITRQDMIVLSGRALGLLKKIEQLGTVTELKMFTDKSLIAPYAVESIASLVKDGLIVGNGNRINPLDNSTRAEAAVLLYRIYNK